MTRHKGRRPGPARRGGPSSGGKAGPTQPGPTRKKPPSRPAGASRKAQETRSSRSQAATRPGRVRLDLNAGCDALRRGHPWIYRDPDVAALTAETGDVVDVHDARDGSFIGAGLFDASSTLAIRLFTDAPDEAIDRGLFARRLEAAMALREQWVVTADQHTAYRLVNGEGDRLPGLVIDRYADFAVVQPYARVWIGELPWIASWLMERLALQGVAHRSRVRRMSDLSQPPPDELLAGEPIPDELLVYEHGLAFLAHTRAGQKTGLFLDHRDNRLAVARYAQDARVLNAFSYTGGFSVYACRAGARETVNVDLARACAEYARRNYELNDIDPTGHSFEVGDVFEYLAGDGKHDFDLVILDPPSFAHSRKQVFNARKGYLRLIERACERVRPGGTLVCCSCTAQLDATRFFQICAEATRRAGRDYRVLETRGLPPDHPTLPGHPEGRYLKVLIGTLL